MSDLPEHNDKDEPLNTPSGVSRAPAAPLPPNSIPGGAVGNMPEGTIDRSDPAHPAHPDHLKHYPGIDPNILPEGLAHPTTPSDPPAGAVPQTHVGVGHPENPAGPGYERGAQWDKAAEKEAGTGSQDFHGNQPGDPTKAEANQGEQRVSPEDAKNSAKESAQAQQKKTEAFNEQKGGDQKAEQKGEQKDPEEDKWTGNEDGNDLGSPAHPLNSKHRAWKAKFRK